MNGRQRVRNHTWLARLAGGAWRRGIFSIAAKSCMVLMALCVALPAQAQRRPNSLPNESGVTLRVKVTWTANPPIRVFLVDRLGITIFTDRKKEQISNLIAIDRLFAGTYLGVRFGRPNIEYRVPMRIKRNWDRRIPLEISVPTDVAAGHCNKNRVERIIRSSPGDWLEALEFMIQTDLLLRLPQHPCNDDERLKLMEARVRFNRSAQQLSEFIALNGSFQNELTRAIQSRNKVKVSKPGRSTGIAPAWANVAVNIAEGIINPAKTRLLLLQGGDLITENRSRKIKRASSIR